MIDNNTEISVKALRTGDRLQFTRLVEKYSTPIYRLGLKMMGNVQDAEDILQITFLKALQHISDFEGRSSLSTWLYRIAANEALMLMRRTRPTLSLDDEPEDGDGDAMQPMQIADWRELPESEIISIETKMRLDRAIQNLPAKLRIVFIMRDIEGLSIKETGEVLGLSETAVKTRLLRARLNLREQLADYFGKTIMPGETGYEPQPRTNL